MPGRILIVDDLVPNVKLLEAKLAKQYYQTIPAYSGAEALEKAAQETPDLILLDVMMPIMDGFEACEKLKADPATAHIPVVMITALTETEDRVHGLQVGAEDFLSKPLDDLALYSRVGSLIRYKLAVDDLRVRAMTASDLGLEAVDDPPIEFLISPSKVLLIEDNQVDYENIKNALASEGDEITWVKSGTETFEAIAQTGFDLIILSLTMLDEDGLMLCSQVRTQPQTRDVPVLLTADEGDSGRVAKGLELGATDYVIKPIERNELVARRRNQLRSKRYLDRLHQHYESSLTMVMTDSLTGLYNRRYLDRLIENLLASTQAIARPTTVMMMDVDHFKNFNDQHGHAVGDKVLHHLGFLFRDNTRQIDTVARYGGEEFVVVCPEVNETTATRIAERIRTSVENSPITLESGEALAVTISIGVASSPHSNASPQEMLKAADDALYKAKEQGRNQVVMVSLDG
ncbi:MAG: PleD family two-component system response regulator [Pseudomonadota bacterium]